MRFSPLPALLWLLLPAAAWAGSVDRYVLKTWETDDGLPNNVVDAVVKRSDGFLWVGTLSGAVRFDGTTFSPLRLPTARVPGDLTVRSLIEENPDTLLIAGSGPDLWRWNEGRLSSHPAAAQMTPTAKMAKLFRESNDVFWIAFDDRTAWRWDHGRIERFPPPPPSRVGETRFARGDGRRVYLARGNGIELYRAGALVTLPVEGLPALGSSSTGGAWMAVSNRLYRLEGDRPVPIAQNLPWSAETHPSLVYEARDGSLWIALAEGGVWRWTTSDCAPMTLSFSKVRDICEDDEGDLWLGTAGGGLDRLQPMRFTLIERQPGVVAGIFGTVCEDVTGVVWFGQSTAVTRLPADGSPPVPAPASWAAHTMPLCPDRKGGLWTASGNRLLWSPPGRPDEAQEVESSNPAPIRVLYGARDGSLWVGRESGPLECFVDGHCRRFGKDQGFPEDELTQAIGEDQSGVLWIGGRGGRLFSFDGGRFHGFTPADGLPGNSIRAIDGDADGAVWIATGGGGLVARVDGRFVRLDKSQGLPDDTLNQILEDNFGYMWFATPRWLFRVAKRELLECARGRLGAVVPEIYGRSAGLSGFTAVDGYQPEAWKTAKGRLWFVTRKGLVGTDPVADPPRPPRRIRIDRFAVDGRAVSGDRPDLRDSDANYEFAFTSPAYAAPQDLRYRYRLTGLESKWNEPTTQRAVIYPALAPGRYEFAVEARDGNGPWSDPAATRSFEVEPQWWENGWTRLAGAGLMASGLWVLVRQQSNRRLKRRLQNLELSQRLEAERSRIARDLHDSLGAGLTRISMIAEEMCEDTETLEGMKAQSRRLRDRVRTAAGDLEGAVWAVSPQNDNLSSLCGYLGQHCLEYFRHTDIRCRVDFGDAMPATPVSPDMRHHLFMIVTELANNVAKHSGATQVELTMRLAGDDFDLTLADNGRGFDPSVTPPGRHGLGNLRSRAADIGGAVSIHSSAEGTAVRVIAPISGAGAPGER